MRERNLRAHLGRNIWGYNLFNTWHHKMVTFSALLALCAVTGEFPSERPVGFDVFIYLRLNKRLSKQSIPRWFEMPLRSLWRHCNENTMSMGLRQERNSSCNDETDFILRPSDLYFEISLTGEKTSLYTFISRTGYYEDTAKSLI